MKTDQLKKIFFGVLVLGIFYSIGERMISSEDVGLANDSEKIIKVDQSSKVVPAKPKSAASPIAEKKTPGNAAGSATKTMLKIDPKEKRKFLVEHSVFK